MAAAAPLRLMLLAHLLLVILGHPGQTESPQGAGSEDMSPTPSLAPSDELSALRVVNQLAVRQMMQNVSNVTQGVTELREDMQQEVDRILEEVRQPEEEPQPQEEEEGKELPVYYGPMIQSDTVPSMCSGNKTLVGSMGVLEVVSSGTYANNVLCSWNIILPIKAPLSLDWVYFELENACCGCDWVEVKDLSRGGASVYGGKLCRKPESWMVKRLDKVLPPTNNILVTFRSDVSVVSRGFRLNYHVVAP